MVVAIATNPPSQTVLVNDLRPISAAFAPLASGARGSVTFPITAVIPPTAATNGSANLTLTFQAAPPVGVPTPQPRTIGAATIPLAYVRLTSSDEAYFWSMPAFAFTFPAGRLSGYVYLALYDSNNAAAGWSAIAGPVKDTGTSVAFGAPTLQQTYYPETTYVFAVVKTNHPLPAQNVPMGVDYGLRRQCVRTLYPGEKNFWFENTDCPGGAYPTKRYWLALNEIEDPAEKIAPCIGVSGQSVPFNGPGSPVTQTWTGDKLVGYTVDFKVDYTHLANVCPPPTFSATGIQDSYGFDAAAQPRPDQMQLEYDVTYDRTVGNMGATHNSVSMGGIWFAAGYPNFIVAGMQIDTWVDPGLYGPPNPDLPPDILSDVVTVDPGSKVTTFAIVYDGSKLSPQVVTPPGTPEHITIDWGKIIAHAIAEKILPPPVHGWDNSGARSQDTNIGFEVENKIAGAGGPMGDLKISNYRVSSLLPGSAP